MRKYSLLGLAVVALFVVVASANASVISAVEAQGTGTTATLDSNPVITAILSQPGSYNGKSYSSWSFTVNDGTGSMVVYGALPGAYTPVVGDAITVSGTNSPYHQIPELGSITSISKVSSGNAVAAPTVATIPQLNQSPLLASIAGYMITVKNVTISGISGTFGTANLTGTITDASNNSMTLYHWPTSYSVGNVNLYGKPIPTTTVDITGFMSVYSSTPEFTPISIAATPEPATMTLLALGGLGLIARRRNR